MSGSISKGHLATAVLMLAALGAAVFATRPTPAPEGLPDPATMPIEYRPGAYFPKGFPLHGSVRLMSAPVAQMGQRVSVRVEYTVGDLPVETGQSIEIWKHFTSDVEEFQVANRDEPAYFGAETTAPGVTFETRFFTNEVQRNEPSVFPYRKTAGATVTAGRLKSGDQVIFDLGGTKGVRMQHYEENLFNFRVVIVQASDGKVLGYGGDAIMKITGGALAKLKVQAPSIVALGEQFAVEVVPQDEWGSLARDYQGLMLAIDSENVSPGEFEYEQELMHYAARRVVANSEGVQRIRVRTRDGRLAGVSNPIWVERHPVRRVFYGDLHQHTYLHDGRGVYEELYLYARRVGLLDFGALTPHHMPLSVTGPAYHLEGASNPRDNWPELVQANKTMKGWKGFVPILSYEYSVGTKAGGHHNVFYNADEAPTVMQIDPNHPMAPIGDMLKTLDRTGKPALVIPHIGGGPPDWNHPTDQRLERAFEIASVHGVFEESYQKHLESGQRLAASASGDTHTTSFGNAYPGLIYTMTNALTGVYSLGRSRDEIWNGIYQKRTFGVTGNTRILLDLEVNGERMGGEVLVSQADTARIHARVSGTRPLTRVELLKNSKVIHSVYPSRNRGRIARVIWGDNIYQRRANVGLSRGELRPGAGTLRLREVLNRDQAFENISQDGAGISWRTAATSNDRDGALVDLSGVTGDSLHFRIDDPDLGVMEVDIPLAKLKQDGYFAWESVGNGQVKHPYMQMMGVPVKFSVECELLNDEGPMDYELNYEDREAPKAGDYYYVRMEQLDTNKGWTSPVWFD